jgi:hypothetical protein
MAQALDTLKAGADVMFNGDLVRACVELFEVDGYRFPEI